MPTVEPIQFPEWKLKSGMVFQLRFTYAAHYQLARWALNLASATTLELAAAACGSVDQDGRFHNAGFARPIDLADIMEAEDGTRMSEAVVESLKKARLVAEPSAPPTPGPTDSTKTSGSGSGHSARAEPVSA